MPCEAAVTMVAMVMIQNSLRCALRNAMKLRWWKPVLIVTSALLVLAVGPMLMILVRLRMATTLGSLAQHWRDIAAFVPLALFLSVGYAVFVFVVEVVRCRTDSGSIKAP